VERDIPYIWKVGGVMLGVAGITVIVAVLASYYSSKIAMGHGRDIRKEVFSHIQTFAFKAFDELGTASLITRTTNDVTQIQQVMMMVFRRVLAAPVSMSGGIIMAVSKDAKVSLVARGVMPFLVLAILFILKKAMPLFKAVQKRLDKLNLIMRENLTGVRVIRAFNKEEDRKSTRLNSSHVSIS